MTMKVGKRLRNRRRPSPANSPASARAMTLEDIAVETGKSVRTVMRWLDRYPDFPRPQTGMHGRYDFDQAEFARWWSANRDAIRKRKKGNG